MIIRDAAYADLVTVAALMRDDDRREILAGRFDDDLLALADDLWRARPRFLELKALCAEADVPVAIIGAALLWPGVASVIMFATDNWPSIAFAATRWVKREAIPVILAPRCHRLQCEAWEENRISRKWLLALGFDEEGVRRSYGKGGEHFVMYGRLTSWGEEELTGE